MKSHKFKYTGLKNNKKTYDVTCLKEGGSFNTSLWDLGKVKRQVCPCCNMVIKKENKNKMKNKYITCLKCKITYDKNYYKSCPECKLIKIRK